MFQKWFLMFQKRNTENCVVPQHSLQEPTHNIQLPADTNKISLLP